LTFVSGRERPGFLDYGQVGWELDLEVAGAGGDVAEFEALHHPCADVLGQPQEPQVGIDDGDCGREQLHQRFHSSPGLRPALIRQAGRPPAGTVVPPEASSAAARDGSARSRIYRGSGSAGPEVTLSG
jgi:hypothetical protein